jgi:DNA-binding winged helix-turn-helix (wHTH) protein
MSNSQQIYDFGPFSLHIAEQQLFCDGKPLRLTLKAFAVLRILVENSSHLVTKHELMQQVWPNSYVHESNLAQAIAGLRRALGESHQSHKAHGYIETVSRRGYRFIAVVTVRDWPSSKEPGRRWR